ncbi:MAG: radical SAM protein [Fidelibacterota bacterium]
MIKNIRAKSILSPLRSNGYDPFGIAYNMNIYRGCQHQCIYCDSRSSCYQIENFADILVKENAVELLVKELAGKRKKLTIGTGSMNDPYMPVEKEMGMTRQALEQIARFRYPIHVITKSDLVLRDADLLKEIAKTYAAVSFTITIPDDDLSVIIEPDAPPSSKRFEAMKHLSREGIYTGIVISPVLPWITDSPEYISALLRRAHNAGAAYALAWPGMTLRRGQREWYYNKLDEHFPGIKEKYIGLFGNTYQCESLNADTIHNTYYNVCRELRLATRMKFYEPVDPQMDLFNENTPA